MSLLQKMAMGTLDKPQPSRQEIWKMFDAISPTYDTVNRILSFGVDRRWRKSLIKHLPDFPQIRLLDLATGTGDQIFFMMDKSQKISAAIGIDLSKEMLIRGTRKLIHKSYNHRVSLMEGDAMDIAITDKSVECVTMAFGIRNVIDIEKCLAETYRVLTPKGRLLILEFSMPKNKLIRGAHLFYLRKILPNVGGIISRNRRAYRYLNQTIETFPVGDEFCKQLRNVGFQNVQFIPLSGGIATLYIGDKPE